MTDINGEVTLGELYRVTLAQTKTLDEIKADVRAQNGRVGQLEVVSREHRVKIDTLNHEVFDGPRRRREAEAKPVEAEARGVTRRDVAMVSAGALGL